MKNCKSFECEENDYLIQEVDEESFVRISSLNSDSQIHVDYDKLDELADELKRIHAAKVSTEISTFEVTG